MFDEQSFISSLIDWLKNTDYRLQMINDKWEDDKKAIENDWISAAWNIYN
jgi:hypothetical protein